MDAIISIVNELYENIWVLLGAFTGCAIVWLWIEVLQVPVERFLNRWRGR